MPWRGSRDRWSRTDLYLGRPLRCHVLGQAQRLFDGGLDDLRLGHRLDHLALHEDLTLAVATGDAQGRPRASPDRSLTHSP